MKNWIQSGVRTDFITEKRRLFDVSESPGAKHQLGDVKIPLLEQLVVPRIEQAMQNNQTIIFRCDYDVDGIASEAILSRIMRAKGYANYKVLDISRMRGYGLSISDCWDIADYPAGLCILADNGISAHAEVKKLNDWGWDVIILDHHEASTEQGPPDCYALVNPCAYPDQSEYHDYCGAGLCYKLAEIMLADNEKERKKCLAFAALATVADSVPLVDPESHLYENWLIVKEGMAAMTNKEYRTTGLYVLLRTAGLDYNVDEQGIGFKIAPILNAGGRLEEWGSMTSFTLLDYDGNDFAYAQELVDKLTSLNNQRKSIQTEVFEKEQKEIGTIPKYDILVRYIPDVPEGIVGLIAGNISEAYDVTTIVFTGPDEKGVLKCSSRVPKNSKIHIKNLLDAHQTLLTKYGGHEKAAGASIQMQNGDDPGSLIDRLRKALETDVGEYKGNLKDGTKKIYYDYEISEYDAEAMVAAQSLFAPYGVGNPAPVFVVKNANLVQKYGNYYKILGATKSTIKLYFKTMDAVNFKGDGLETYTKAGLPRKVSLIGTLSDNVYNGKHTPQFNFVDVVSAT